MEPTDGATVAGGGPERAAERRDQAARERDQAAGRRDQAGQQRDQAADLRDQLAEQRDYPGGGAPVGDGRAAGVPDLVTLQQLAASDRHRSRQDRADGAGDRVQAAYDRSSALTDRSASASDRRHARLDGLTGVYAREAGLWELDRDLARVKRTDQSLVLAFIDVDHLKAINDEHGHAAGDRLLHQVATTLQATLRPYDLIIRYGGDEFLCAVQGIDALIAGPRFAHVNTLLARAPERGSITVGLAQYQAGESAGSLIARADADLYQQRQQRR